MKKVIFFLVFFIANINISFALNPDDFLNPISKDFQSWCYEFYTKIPRSSFEENKTYKIKFNKPDILITQFGFILPSKQIWNQKEYHTYSTNLSDNIEALIDDNRKTNFQYDIENKSNIILVELEEEIQAWSFKFHFDYLSKLFPLI